MNEVSASPARKRDPGQAKQTALARLRQATWEATQFLSYAEVREYVEGVLGEVQDDEL